MRGTNRAGIHSLLLRMSPGARGLVAWGSASETADVLLSGASPALKELFEEKLMVYSSSGDLLIPGECALQAHLVVTLSFGAEHCRCCGGN